MIFEDGRASETTNIFSRSIPTIERFDSSKWLLAGNEERSSLVGDLIERKLLLAKSKQEVLDFIGKPDRWSTISYDLGMVPLLGEVDGYTLDFELNESDLVLRGGIYQH